MKVHCERIPLGLLRGKRAKWKSCFSSLHFEDPQQLAAGSFNRASSVAMLQLALAATGFLINFFWEMIRSPLYDDVKRKPYAEILR
jgi:hypothetical protein